MAAAAAAASTASSARMTTARRLRERAGRRPWLPGPGPVTGAGGGAARGWGAGTGGASWSSGAAGVVGAGPLAGARAGSGGSASGRGSEAGSGCWRARCGGGRWITGGCGSGSRSGPGPAGSAGGPGRTGCCGRGSGPRSVPPGRWPGSPGGSGGSGKGRSDKGRRKDAGSGCCSHLGGGCWIRLAVACRASAGTRLGSGPAGPACLGPASRAAPRRMRHDAFSSSAMSPPVPPGLSTPARQPSTNEGKLSTRICNLVASVHFSSLLVGPACSSGLAFRSGGGTVTLGACTISTCSS
jgi:hypothetical protein